MQRSALNFKLIIRLVAAIFFISVIFSSFPSDVFAASGINRQINFQGKLVDGSGLTVPDSTYTIIFSFYNAGSGGNPLWTETDSVTTAAGIFRVSLGAINSIPANFNFNWDGLYLGIKISTESQEMLPRIVMTAAPMAFNAQQVAGLTVQDENGNASTSGTLKIPNAKTVSFAGATSFGAGTTGLVTLGSSSDALTFNTAGATTVTLPTSGKLLTDTAAANQTVTSTQSIGTVLGITDSTALSGTIKGLVITLSGGNTQDQTGLEFNLSNANGANLYDIMGTGGNWKVSKNGALTVTSCVGCGGGSNWTLNVTNGTLSPNNNTLDLLIGGTTTVSAKFAILNVAGTNTPIASIAGTFSLGSVAGTTRTIGATAMNALQFGDLTTGDLIFAPNNAAAMIIKNGGKLGIGTTNPLEVLSVTGNASLSGTLAVNTIKPLTGALNLQYKSGTNAWSTALTVLDNTGYVGIGTTTPTQALEVNGTVKATAFSGPLTGNVTGNVSGTAGSLAAQYIDWNSSSGGNSIANKPTNVGSNWTLNVTNGTLSPNNNTLDLLIGGTTTVSAKFAILNVAGTNTPIASIAGTFSLGSVAGTTRTIGATAMNALQFGDLTTGDLIFAPNNAAAMIIKNGGKLGIGTTNPLEVLSVTGNASLSGTLAVNTIKPLTGALNLQYKSGTNAWSTALTVLDNTGYVGIGTTTPTQALEVNGTVKATAFSGPLTGNVTGNVSGTAGSLAAQYIDWNSSSGGNSIANKPTNVGSNWTLNVTNGTLSPNNNTLDLLIGGTTTVSAKFAILNVAGTNTPIASIAGTFSLGSVAGTTRTIGATAMNALQFGDLTTGDLIFAPNNAAAMIIKNGGKLGIGTTNPLEVLSVTGNASLSGTLAVNTIKPLTGALNLQYKSGTNAWSTALTVLDNTGYVGIGTTTPTQALEVNGTVKATAFSGPLTGNVTGNVSGTAGSLAAQYIDWNSSSGGNSIANKPTNVGSNWTLNVTNGTLSPNNNTLDLLIGGTTTVSAKFAILNVAGTNTPIASIAGTFSLGSVAGTTRTIGATAMNALQFGDLTTGDLIFAPNNAAAMIIKNGGKLGIGTTNPLEVLSVTGNASLSGTLAVNTIKPLTGALNLQYKSGTNAWSTALTVLDNTGYVGIGTTTPTQALEVNGTVKATAFSGPLTGNVTGNVSGTAGSLAAQYIDWNSSSGGNSIANKPTNVGSNWTLNVTNGTLSPNNNTLDLLIGGTTTVSAKFAILNVAGTNTPIASIAGTFSLGSVAGTTRTIGATAMNALQFGDLTTGDLIFAPNNAAAMIIKNGGKLGIGTTNPLEVLSVTGNASLSGTLAVNTIKPLTGALNLQYKSGTNAWSTALTVLDNTGYVGIGTTTPTQALEVNGTVKATAFSGPLTGNVTGNVSGTAGSLAAQYIDWNSSSGGNSIANKPTNVGSNWTLNVTNGTLSPNNNTLDLLIGGTTTVSAKFAILNVAGTNTPIASIAGTFSLGSVAGTTRTIGATAMNALQFGDLTTGDLIFAPNNAAAMIIKNGGKLGIGTTNPLEVLSVTGNASLSGTLAVNTIKPLTGALNLQYKSGTNAWSTALTVLDNTGYVGIGTTTPTQALEVNGTVKATAFSGPLTGNVTGNVSGTAGSLAAQYIDWNSSSGGNSIANKPTNVGSNWTLNVTNGTLSPNNNTLDLLIGGTTTVSAKFAILNVAGTNTPIASIAGTFSLGSVAGTTRTIGATAMNALQFGDLTTGDLIFAPNNAAAMIIKNGGKLGIGTTNPLEVLSVTGNASLSGTLAVNTIKPLTGALNLQYKSGTNAWSTALTVLDNTGYVGIGTTTPTQALEVNGTVKATAFSGPLTGNVTGNVSGTAGSLAAQYIDWNSSSGGNSIANKPTNVGSNWTLNVTNGTLSPNNNTLDLLIGGTTTVSAKFAILNVAGTNTPIASIAGTFSLGSVAGTTRTIGATAMNALQFGDLTTGDLIFAPNNAAAMIIKNGGKLGIGTTNPLEVLSVTGNASLSGTLAVNTIKPLTGALNLQYKSGANAWTTALTVLDNTGYVGIGTTTPTQALEVNGTVKATAFSGPLTGNVTGNVSGTAGSLAAQYIDWNSSSGGNSIANKPTNVGSNWTLNVTNGTLSPNNNTLDLLIGGTTTVSAKFAILNVAGTNTPIASIAGTFSLGSVAGTTRTIGATAMNALQFGDLTTGDLIFAPNNAAAMIIKNGGKLGIGTTNPLEVLSVTGNASLSGTLAVNTIKPLTGALNLQYKSGTNAWSTALTVLDNTGYVGIGTTTPTQALEVNGTVKATAFSGPLTGNVTGNVSGTAGSLAAQYIDWNSSSGGNSIANKPTNVGSNWTLNVTNGTLSPNNNTLDLLIGGTTTVSAKFAILNVAGTNTPIASIAGTFSLGSVAGTTRTIGATAMNALQFGDLTTGDLIFAPNNAAAMIIKNGGKLGIGTTNPLEVLSVTGNASLSGTLAVNTIKPLTGALNLQYKSGANAWTTALTVLDNTGYVGIGTTTPTQALEVNGTVKATAFSGPLTGNVTGNVSGTAGSLAAQYIDWNSSSGGNSIANKPTNVGSNWTLNVTNGTLFPNNNTLDLLIGGTTTASAKFAVLNVAGTNTPIASIAGTFSLGSVAGTTRTIGATAMNALQFGDLTTGDLIFAPNNAAAMIIKNGGKLGIGTTNPLEVLSVTGNASLSGTLAVNTVKPLTGALNLQYKSGANAWTTALTVLDNTGYVGIGTVTPNAPLEVLNTTNPQLRLSYSSTVYSTLGTDNNGNLNLVTPNGAGAGIDIISGINSGNGTNEAINLKTNQTIGNADELLQIQNNASPLMTVLGNGNVGIGTTNPLVALDLTGTASISANISMDGAYLTAHTFNILNNSTLNFQRSPGGDTGLTSVLYLGNNGNIGIGTTVPANALDIGNNGGIHITAGTPGSTSMALYNSGGNLTWNGLALATGSSIAGSTGYIPVFNSTTSQINSNIFQSGNNIGIGTTVPLATFDVRAQSNNLPVASVSGATTFAGFVVDQSGIGDIFTASKSGLTRFAIRQNGSVMISNTNSANALSVGPNGTLAGLTFDVDTTNNSVGIGAGANTAAGYTLDVSGNARVGNNTNGDNIVKQTTADFTVTSPTSYSVTTFDGVNNVSTVNNQLALVTDITSQAGYSLAAPAAGPTLPNTLTTASLTFQLPSRRFALLSGNGLKIYDPAVANSNFGGGPTFTAGTIGAGVQAFQRADGAFVIILGGSTSTQLYTPGSTPTTEQGTFAAGPITSAAVGAGSLVIKRSDGKFIIIHGGGAGTTSIYDPTVLPAAGSALIAGPAIAAAGVVNTGSFAFQRPDGKWIVGLGNGSTTNIYDPSTAAGGVGGGGSFVAGPSLSAASGAGAHAIQLPDGRMLVFLGGGSGGSGAVTNVYDPASNTFSVGQSLVSSQYVNTGGHSFQRSDGKWVVVLGGGTTNLQLYDPANGANGTFTTTTGLTGAGAGTGANTFQRPDGMYVIVHGNSQSTSTLYDAGWNTSGTWISEDLNSTKISTYSALFWSANPQSANNTSRLDAETISFFVKTGENSSVLAANSWVGVQDSGDLIKTIGLSTLAKIKVVFTTPVRSYPQGATDYINQTNIWNGEGGTFYRRTFIQPTVFSMKINNPMVAYGDLTGTGDPSFGRNFATDSATMEGVVTDNSNFLKLQTVRNMPVATASAGFIIASASANLGATAAAGTHTIERATGQFLTLIGGTQVTKIYDPDSNTFSPGPALPLAIGAGAHSFLLPDGRFFTICGGGSNNTMIFDPQVNLFITGPKLYGNVGLGANTFERPDGFFVIVDGGVSQVTNILDPYSMAITQGPFTLGAITNGSFNIRYQDGRILVMQGGSAASYVYYPETNAFETGPALTASTTGAGTTVGQLPSGRFWVKAAAALSQIFDPYLDTFAVGPTGNAALAAGAIMIPAPDGRLLYGAGSTSSVVDPASLATAVTGATLTLPCTLAAGSNVFQRQTGEYVVLCGNSANTFIIDAGWNLGGTYTSEQIFEPSLSATTGMYWKNIGQGDIMVKYRTASTKMGLGLAQWKQLPASGSLINYTPGDVWFQTRIDLMGVLQDLPGAKTRVWLSENNGGAVAYYRAVQAPTLQYWELMNTPNPTLLDITSGNQNIFRFTADGQAYTSDGGAWNSGGADLAERYTSTEELEAGEVVIGDKLIAQNVIRSTSPYQTNIMGVVSTQPGFVAGSFTPDSYPIALVGRVPVKISTENGAIHSGDYLTSASIPGYAMKATMAGRVIGTALEDFDPATAIDCPKYGAGSLPATQCGTITVFVNLTSYNGENVELLMADTGFTGGLAEDNGLSTSGYASAMTDQQQQTLAFLKSMRDNGQNNGSEVFADKINASTQIISPTIITDLLIAKTIKADQIEGLQILTNRISALENQSLESTASATETLNQEVLAESTPSANLNNGTLNIADINVEGIATVSADLRVKGNTLVEGILNVVDTVMSQNMIVNQLATFLGDAVFKGNVNFEGRPTFNSDVAGLAVIDKGNDFVEVKFDNEYGNIPIVTATISLNKDVDDSAQKALEEDILSGNFNYMITRKTTKGFIIRLNKKATSDMTFSWVAISVKDPVTTEGKTTFQDYLNSLNNTATPSAASSSVQ